MSSSPPGNRALDHQALHALLWMDAHKERHTLPINQLALAAELHCGQPTLSRTLARMVEDGRMRRIGQSVRNAIYRVEDPDEWGDDGTRRPAEP